ncbi:Smr/MutS family protein [Palleronia rufa]|uniref:Smr/MutS family protein n=1 Tax=Palleronia rufa TaxID=1530186 RepID=UPI0005688FA8|nr:Smr/MutS family protein [Palleronia rufa]
MARRRELRPEERALWKQVADRTSPLHPQRRTALPDALAPKPRPSDTPPRADLSGFRLGGRAQAAPSQIRTEPSLSDRLAGQPLRMDAKAFGRMTRGKLVMDGRIDLHGLTLEEAHPRLTGFLFAAHADGKRLVLVITGKGRDRDDGTPVPVRRGILRHQVPHWLSTPPLSALVLQVAQAHHRHGGAGAFYVYLRRK